MKLIIYLTLFQFLYSCNDGSKENIEVDNFVLDLSSLKKNIILNGDVESYNELSTKFVKDEKYLSILTFSILMAKEYEYLPAYYDVFFYTYSLNSETCYDYDLSCLDSNSRNFALKYLKLGIEKGDESCSSVLLDFYDQAKHYPIKELYTNEELLEKARLNIQAKAD